MYWKLVNTCRSTIPYLTVDNLYIDVSKYSRTLDVGPVDIQLDADHFISHFDDIQAHI